MFTVLQVLVASGQNPGSVMNTNPVRSKILRQLRMQGGMDARYASEWSKRESWCFNCNFLRSDRPSTSFLSPRLQTSKEPDTLTSNRPRPRVRRIYPKPTNTNRILPRRPSSSARCPERSPHTSGSRLDTARVCDPTED